jgi:hypothetical protein
MADYRSVKKPTNSEGTAVGGTTELWDHARKRSHGNGKNTVIKGIYIHIQVQRKEGEYVWYSVQGTHVLHGC